MTDVPPDITEDEVAEHFSNLLNRKVVEVRREATPRLIFPDIKRSALWRNNTKVKRRPTKDRYTHDARILPTRSMIQSLKCSVPFDARFKVAIARDNRTAIALYSKSGKLYHERAATRDLIRYIKTKAKSREDRVQKMEEAMIGTDAAPNGLRIIRASSLRKHVRCNQMLQKSRFSQPSHSIR